MRPADVRRLLSAEAPSARAAAVRRLAGRADAGAVRVVLLALADGHPYVRSAAAGALGQIVDPRARRRVRGQIARLRSAPARAHAAQAFVVWADAEGEAGLLQSLEDRAPRVRQAALEALGDLAPPPFVAAVTKALEASDAGVRVAALDRWVAWRARDALGHRRLDPVTWQRLLADPDPRVRLAALEGSAVARVELASVAVTRGLADAVWSVRIRAAELSVRHADRGVLERLVATLADERRRVRRAAHQALVTITGIPFEPEPTPWRRWLEGDGRAFDPARRPEAPEPRAEADGTTVEAVRFLGVPIVSQHVVFVLDASGSMREAVAPGRTRWDAVRGEVARVLDQLLEEEDTVHVGLVRFADGVERPFEGQRRLSGRLRRTLLADLERTRPSGRTALYDGIAAALADADVGQVIVLSDGAPSAGTYFTKTALLAGVRRANRFRRARIDVVAVAGERIARRWRDVLARIAAEGGGRLIRR